MTPIKADTPALLRMRAVQDRTGLSKTEIYRRMAAGRFPKPLPIGKRAIAWISTEIDAHVKRTIAAARGKEA